jgi:hypothetical protein
MTRERCECGRAAMVSRIYGMQWVAKCEMGNCWVGPNCDTPDAAWAAWDRVMATRRITREALGCDPVSARGEQIATAAAMVMKAAREAKGESHDT